MAVQPRIDLAEMAVPFDEIGVGVGLAARHVLEGDGVAHVLAVREGDEHRPVGRRDRGRRLDDTVAPQRVDPGELGANLGLAVIGGPVHPHDEAPSAVLDQIGRVLGDREEADLRVRGGAPRADHGAHAAFEPRQEEIVVEHQQASGG